MLTLDPYVIDTLLPDLVGHDRRPSAYLVYLCLWRRSRAGGAEITASLMQLAEATGLSKRSVQEAIEHLARRGLVTVSHPGVTAAGRFVVHEPWAGRAG
jgi:DNA-binding MarR family transcriptional regulator